MELARLTSRSSTTSSRPSHEARSSISARTAFVTARVNRDVLVDGVHTERRRLAVGGRVELSDEPVVVEDRQREVSPAPLVGRLVHLEEVLEVEELLGADAVVDRAGRRATAAPCDLRSHGRERPDRPPTRRRFPRPPRAHRPPPRGTARRRRRSPPAARCRASAAGARRWIRRACRERDGFTRGYTRSARSHSRCRPTRPAIATSPRELRNSSICVTLRLPVQPLDCHGTTLVSGTSRDISGPDSRSRRSTSWRKESFCSSHCWATGPGGGEYRLSSFAYGHAAIASR